MERIARHTTFLELRTHQIEQHRSDLAPPVVRMCPDPGKAAASILAHTDRPGKTHHCRPVRRDQHGIWRVSVHASFHRSLPTAREQCLHKPTQRVPMSGFAQPEQDASRSVIFNISNYLLPKFELGKRRFHEQTHGSAVAESPI